MSSFTVIFMTDNTAFEHGNLPDEIARILREVAIRVECGDQHGLIRDVNSNRVGSFGTGAMQHTSTSRSSKS